MLKEERELRNYIAFDPDIESRCQRGLYRLITALVRAVREDEREKMWAKDKADAMNKVIREGRK